MSNPLLTSAMPPSGASDYGFWMQPQGGRDWPLAVSSSSSSSTSSKSVAKPRGQSCELTKLQSNTDWQISPATILFRVLVQIAMTFVMVMISLLLTQSYDTVTSPLAAALPAGLIFFVLSMSFRDFSWIPAATFAETLMPIAYCRSDTASVKQGPDGTGARGYMVSYRMWLMDVLGPRCMRVVIDIASQFMGGILAAAAVKGGMLAPGDNVDARFDAHVRDDIANATAASNNVFWYSLMFNGFYACVVYSLHFHGEKVTCESVHQYLCRGAPLLVGVAYYLVSAAATPMFGVATINLNLSLGAAVVTGTTPSYYGSLIAGQFVAFYVVARLYRFAFEYMRKCENCLHKVQLQVN